MLFTWDTTNLCIVFPSWRVTGTLSLIVSLLAVVALTAGYEAIREVSRRYEEGQDAKVREAPRKFSFLFCYLLAPPVPWNSSGSGIVHEEVCLSVCLVVKDTLPKLFAYALLFPAATKTTSNEAHSLRQAMPSRRKRKRARRSKPRCTACRSFIRSSSCEFCIPAVYRLWEPPVRPS